MLDDKALHLLETRVDSLKRRDKDKDAERKVIDEVFDNATLLTVYKFFSDEVIDTVEFSISTGKEANVFYATSKHGPRVVKIYRISNATFKTISKYIFGDPRFKRITGDRRRTIFTWAQKEFKNLKKAVRAEVRVPEPIACRNNVLVMGYIGNEEMPAPLLKDTALEDPEAFYTDLMLQMRRMYHYAGLVHCDMSEYNILVQDGVPCIIDMGQAVLRRHPMAQEFIERDAKNLSHLFKKRGLKKEAKDVLEDLTEPLEWKKMERAKAPSRYTGKREKKPRRAKRTKGVKE